MMSLLRALIQYDLYPYKKRKLRHRCVQRQDHSRHRRNMAMYKAKREASEENNFTNTLISDFQPPKLWDNKFPLFNPPSPWSFVMTALDT